MRGLLTLEKVLLALQGLALIGVIARLVATGLFRTYKSFFAYLLIQLGQFSIPLFIDRNYNLYAYAFFGTEAVISVFYALNLLELYSLVFRNLRGIATISSRYIRISVALAIGASLLVIRLERASNPLDQLFTAERIIVSSLMLFVFLITLLLAYYPISLNRNVINYSIGYAVYFTSKALALYLRNNGRDWVYPLSEVSLAVSTACLIFWIFALRPDVDQDQGPWVRQWNPRDHEKLLEQLEAINASLIRVRK